jgi:hypothetical protein
MRATASSCANEWWRPLGGSSSTTFGIADGARKEAVERRLDMGCREGELRDDEEVDGARK